MRYVVDIWQLSVILIWRELDCHGRIIQQYHADRSSIKFSEASTFVKKIAVRCNASHDILTVWHYIAYFIIFHDRSLCCKRVAWLVISSVGIVYQIWSLTKVNQLLIRVMLLHIRAVTVKFSSNKYHEQLSNVNNIAQYTACLLYTSDAADE